MDRDLLGHLPIIVCVARHRSFAAAASELGMSPSAVSHAVRTGFGLIFSPVHTGKPSFPASIWSRSLCSPWRDHQVSN